MDRICCICHLWNLNQNKGHGLIPWRPGLASVQATSHPPFHWFYVSLTESSNKSNRIGPVTSHAMYMQMPMDLVGVHFLSPAMLSTEGLELISLYLILEGSSHLFK